METLKRIRMMRGMNQVDLAKASGVSQNTISEIETGRREARAATLRKLASALDVDIADFFEEANYPKAQAPQPSLEDAAQSEALQEALAALFRNLAHRGQRIIEQSLKEGPSEALTRELNEYQKEAKEAAKLYKIKGGRSIFGHDSEELAEAEEAYQEVEGRIQAMLRQDIESTDEERRNARRFKGRDSSSGTEKRKADAS